MINFFSQGLIGKKFLKGNHFLLKKIELWGHQQKNPSLEEKKLSICEFNILNTETTNWKIRQRH